MSDLIERYVHQVGRYLPRHERAEIQIELRSQLEDQLEDRFGSTPTEADIKAVLTEMGPPHRMAASYAQERYLIGPTIYPILMMVLRHGWLLVPMIVVFLHLFGLLTGGQTISLTNLLLEPLWAALQATLSFSALVVLIFAFYQRFEREFEKGFDPFDPAELPEVNDPHTVDRTKATSGVATGTIVMLILSYFLSVGGLTLRLNPAPGDIIPVPPSWMIVLIVSAFGMVIVHLVALLRNHWNSRLWLTQMILEMIGVVCLYFVLYRPLVERVVSSNPALGDIPIAEIIAIISGVLGVVSNGTLLIRLLNTSTRDPVPKAVSTSQ
ncbi:MAG TPA: hypothetical protein PLQ56_02310 [Aggregatilineales bacterium]|nr:hypothetical protein [Aggregatilineales bacterium]